GRRRRSGRAERTDLRRHGADHQLFALDPVCVLRRGLRRRGAQSHHDPSRADQSLAPPYPALTCRPNVRFRSDVRSWLATGFLALLLATGGCSKSPSSASTALPANAKILLRGGIRSQTRWTHKKLARLKRSACSGTSARA